jgi:hypothetical protein
LRLCLGIVVAAFFTCSAPVVAEQYSYQPSDLAPADEYFGRFQLSVLGVSNTLRDAGIHLQLGDDPQPIVDGALASAADAIRAWERTYPRDPWIRRDLLLLVRDYVLAQTDESHARAVATESWLVQDYPNCVEARDAESALYIGLK